jgi:hypothetical protein
MPCNIWVCSVLSDLARRTAGGSGNILLFGVTGRLMLVLALLLSGVDLHCDAGFESVSMVSSAHVGRGGNTGASRRLSCCGCLEGPLIVS